MSDRWQPSVSAGPRANLASRAHLVPTPFHVSKSVDCLSLFSAWYMFCCSVVVLEIRLFKRSGLWSTTFLLVLVSVSDKENSGFYFTIGQDHYCRDVNHYVTVWYLLCSMMLTMRKDIYSWCLHKKQVTWKISVESKWLSSSAPKFVFVAHREQSKIPRQWFLIILWRHMISTDV